MAQQDTQEPMTDQSVFEGMFTRVLKPTGEFAAALKAIGYDVNVPQAKYPTRVWKEALDVAHRFAAPGMPRDAAMRQLGFRFAEGFYSTIIGQMIRVTMPILGAMRVLQRMPRQYEAVQSGTLKVVEEGPTQVRVEAQDAYPEPDFMAGLMEAGARHAKAAGLRSEVIERRPDGYALRISWTNK